MGKLSQFCFSFYRDTRVEVTSFICIKVSVGLSVLVFTLSGYVNFSQ